MAQQQQQRQQYQERTQALALSYLLGVTHELLDRIWLLLTPTGLTHCLSMLNLLGVTSLYDAHRLLQANETRLRQAIYFNWRPYLLSPIYVRRRLFAEYQQLPLYHREILAGFLVDNIQLRDGKVWNPDTIVAQRLLVDKSEVLMCPVRNDILALFAEYTALCTRESTK